MGFTLIYSKNSTGSKCYETDEALQIYWFQNQSSPNQQFPGAHLTHPNNEWSVEAFEYSFQCWPKVRRPQQGLAWAGRLADRRAVAELRIFNFIMDVCKLKLQQANLENCTIYMHRKERGEGENFRKILTLQKVIRLSDKKNSFCNF